uniref:RZ-type domain-containing protein n=1 Tax=Branchiostoma floridae TaxID=7739 RepID=C3ZFR8_BRAFL|eukprot:XP_002592545.1 hypothetical protein BRAFLDRAFT_108419 [Branchiostoma floridae]
MAGYIFERWCPEFDRLPYRPGLGKSLYVQRLAQKLHVKRQPTRRTSCYLKVPFHEAVIDVDSVLSALNKQEQNPEKPTPSIIHLDVSPMVRKGLDYFLFNLTVLGRVMGKDGKVWLRLPWDLYLIERTSDTPDLKITETSTNCHFPFVTFLPFATCRAPNEILDLDTRFQQGTVEEQNAEDPIMYTTLFTTEEFQRPYQYLRHLESGEDLDKFTFTPGVFVNNHVDFLTVVLRHCGIKDPSWAELRHFLSFLNYQLRDYEQSDFCKTFLHDSLPGLRKFVVEFMIIMSKDFATPSLEMADESPSFKVDDTDAAETEDPIQYHLRRRWENSPHPYLFFNSDHHTMTFLGFHVDRNGNIRDPTDNSVLQHNVMKKQLWQGLDLQGVDLNANFDKMQRVEKIRKLRMVMGLDKGKYFDPDESYELTTDNVKKILAIHMRFRCNIPVIIMGETGCGKTRLVKFMCDLQAGPPANKDRPKNMIIMKLHGGVSAADIIRTVKKAQRLATENRRRHNVETVLFLDEANTSEAIGLIKEIMCDGTVNGKPLPTGEESLKIVAAVNPYRRGICQHDERVMTQLQTMLGSLAGAYTDLYRPQLKDREYFGLRDFYSLIKMVSNFSRTSGHPPSRAELEHAIKRNFSGRDDVDPLQNFRKVLETCADQTLRPTDPDCSPLGLIKASLESVHGDSEGRYLLILTKNYAALALLQQELLDPNSTVILFGSSFPQDQEYTQICRDINRIKVCMETGRTVVLLNLENLYESLYDALNQYYVEMGGQKYVDLGLGTHRVKCRVHKDFRLLVVAEKDIVYEKFPIPLINRLEKHVLSVSTILTPAQCGIAKRVGEWAKAFVNEAGARNRNRCNKKPDEAFIGYHEDLPATVVHRVCQDVDTNGDMWKETVFERAKETLLQCATPDAVVCLGSSHLTSEADTLAHKYFHDQHHSSLADFLLHNIQKEGRTGLLAQVTTHGRLLSRHDLPNLRETLSLKAVVQLLSLQQFDTEQQFSRRIGLFLEESLAEGGLMVVQCDSGDINTNLIACASYTVNTERAQTGNLRSSVVFVIQLPRNTRKGFSGLGGGQWQCYHIDDVHPPDNSSPDVATMLGRSVSSLIRQRVTTLLDLNDDALTDLCMAVNSIQIQNVNSPRQDIKSERLASPKDQQREPVPQDTIEPDNSELEDRIDVATLFRSSVQSAAARLTDPSEVKQRTIDRIELLLKLLANKGKQTEARLTFAEVLSGRVAQLLMEQEESQVHMGSNWLSQEAAASKAIRQAGTLRRSAWVYLKSVVSPMLAEVIAFFDRNFNLDLLKTKEEWLRQLWLHLAANDKAINLHYEDCLSPKKRTVRETVPVQTSGYDGQLFQCHLPFSWLIRELVDKLWQDATVMTARTSESFQEVLRDAFDETEIGRQLSKATKSCTDPAEIMVRYIHDYVLMTQKITTGSEVEIKLFCRAVEHAVSIVRESQEIPLAPHVTDVHIAVDEGIRSCLSRFSQLVESWPDQLPTLETALCNRPNMVLGDEPNFKSRPTMKTLELFLVAQSKQAAFKHFAEALRKHQAFRRRSNAFFMDVVSMFCFADDVPPDQEVIDMLLGFIVREVDGTRARTKGFSPFQDECVDRTPIIRSFLLQLLLRFKFLKVCEHLEKYFEEARGFAGNMDDAVEVCVIFVQCMELNMIASVRSGLSIACDVMYSQVNSPAGRVVNEHSQRSLRRLFVNVQTLFRDFEAVTRWPKLFIPRHLYKRYGIDTLLSISQSPESQWLLPEEMRGNQIQQMLVQFSRSTDAIRNKELADRLILNNNEGHCAQLSFRPNQPPRQRSLSALIVHMSTVLATTPTNPLLEPLKALAAAPHTMLAHYLPTMPNDPLPELMKALADQQVGWYQCPNGHHYVIGDCTKPATVGKCHCGADIGGIGYKLMTGNLPGRQDDATSTGHIIGDAQDRPVTPIPERQLSKFATVITRFVLHASMLSGANTTLQPFTNFVRPVPLDINDFLWRHLNRDLDDLAGVLGRSIDDATLLVHILLAIVSHSNNKVADWNVAWTTAQGRENWENAFNNVYIEPLLQDLDRRLEKANRLVDDNHRLLATSFHGVLSDYSTPPDQLSLENVIGLPEMWQYRPSVSLEHMSRCFVEHQARFPMLKMFLDNAIILSAMCHLPDIIHLITLLRTRYHRNIDLTEALTMKIAEFLKSLPEGQQGEECDRLVKCFGEIWTNIRPLLLQQESTPRPVNMDPSIDTQTTSLYHLLPMKEDATITSCVTAVVLFLIRKNNEFLDIYRRETNFQDDGYFRSWTDVSTGNVVSCDTARDLMPLVLSHCNYSLAIGQGTQVGYDFPALEKQLIDRFLSGKSKIEEKCETFQFRQEARDVAMFSAVRKQIPQETIGLPVQRQIVLESTSLENVCVSLAAVDIAIFFLASAGGDGEKLLGEYLHRVLKMGRAARLHSDKARNYCRLKHALSLWQLLSVQRAQLLLANNQDPFDNVDISYTKQLEEEQTKALESILKKIDVKTLAAEMYEFVVVSDEKEKRKPDWSLRDTLASYLDEKDAPEINGFLPHFPATILLEHVCDTWRVLANYMHHQEEDSTEITVIFGERKEKLLVFLKS